MVVHSKDETMVKPGDQKVVFGYDLVATDLCFITNALFVRMPFSRPFVDWLRIGRLQGKVD